MAEQNPGVGEAGHPRGLDELRVLEHQHLAAHQLGVAHPPHQPQGDEQVDQSLAQDGHDGDDQNGEGEGHHDIGDAHEQAVQEAAVVAGQQSDHAAHQKGNHHAQHADEQIDAGTPDDAGEDVATVEVRTEPVGRTGGLVGHGDVGGDGIVGGDELGNRAMRMTTSTISRPITKEGLASHAGMERFCSSGLTP